MRQPIQVAVIVVRYSDNAWEYLILHRNRDTGSYWQSVSGGVENDEQVLETAHRELEEETGFRPVSLEAIQFSDRFPVPESMKYHYQSHVTHLVQQYFLAIVETGINPKIDPKEHDDWRWCKFEEAEKLLHWPANKEATRNCEVILHSLNP